MSALENYTFIKVLGEGAFSKVKCKGYIVAQHMITRQKVAVKLLDVTENKKELRSIAKEVKILRELNHPHIVKLYALCRYDFKIIDNKAFLVFEYVSGGEFYNLIERQGRIDEYRARKYFQQILSAVECVHSCGFTHRDLKPENILLDSRDNLKLTDFGLSDYMKDGVFLNTFCGSSNYAAPEMISHRKYCGTEVDVWSLGVLLYAMLAAKLPFDEPSIPALFQKIKKGEYTIPVHFSGAAADLIRKCLVVDPLARATVGGIKQHPWIQSCRIFIQPSPKLTKDSFQLDECIVEQLRTHPKFSGVAINKAKLKENIIGKTFDLMATCYEMLEGAKSYTNNSISPSAPVFANTRFPFRYPDPPKGWEFGIRLAVKPADLIERLFTALKECELEWRIVEKFTIHAKSANMRVANVPIQESNKCAGFRYVKLEINIYSIIEDYMIDLRRIAGETLYFLDVYMIILGKLTK